MYARVTTVEVPPDAVDAAVRQFEEVTLPQIQSFPGWEGATMFVDRENGVVRTLAYFSGREPLDSSRETAKRLRSDFVERAQSARLISVEEFEVALRAEPAKKVSAAA